jgi:hypothetical protein
MEFRVTILVAYLWGLRLIQFIAIEKGSVDVDTAFFFGFTSL